MARALLTGCAGFIGSHLTESPLAAGYDMVGIDVRDSANLATAHEYDEFDLVKADLAELDLSELTACDVVFHLAGEPGVRGSWGERFDVYTGADISRPRAELGFNPRTRVAEGLQSELEWVLAQRNLASLSARWQSRRSSPSWRLTSASSSMRRSR